MFIPSNWSFAFLAQVLLIINHIVDDIFSTNYTDEIRRRSQAYWIPIPSYLQRIVIQVDILQVFGEVDILRDGREPIPT